MLQHTLPLHARACTPTARVVQVPAEERLGRVATRAAVACSPAA
jgi:hypothetical protein